MTTSTSSDVAHAVIGHDGRTYRALTIPMVDLHIRKITERIVHCEKRRMRTLADQYRDDRDHLLERRSYLMLAQALDSETAP